MLIYSFKKIICNIIYLLFIFLNATAFSQVLEEDGAAIDYYEVNYLRYDNYIYNDDITSVQFHEHSWELSPPVIKFGSKQKLKLSFDDLSNELKNLNYTVVHCEASWEPSTLLPNEFIDGFTENIINDYQYSFNTIQNYIHYNVVFPNENFNLTKSGNYLLKVYENGDPSRLVVSRRFMVYDERVSIVPEVKPATIISDRNYKQEIDFTVFYPSYDIHNPYSDLTVYILQNDRWDNAITNLKPLFVKDKELVYDYDNDNVFWGGNEFRYFDIKSLRYQSERIKTITFDSLKRNNVYLLPDEKRSYKRYYTYQDLNGKYTVKAEGESESEVAADYAYVHFFLPLDEPLTDGNLYVYGALTNWNCHKQNRMEYNEKSKGYEARLYLKQGYYNYEYVFYKDEKNMPDEVLIEGTHYETENDYVIYLYHRAQGTYYDQLIGVKRLNSTRGGY